MMKLEIINIIEGEIELLSGLHIGAGNEQIHIGGIDNAVIKHPYTNQPYIPGSSIKGKMRSLIEWRAGLISQSGGKPVGSKVIQGLSGDQRQQAVNIAQLFGIAGDSKNDPICEEVGPTRISLWDCGLSEAWLDERKKSNQLLTEAKFENTINRISGTADNPRQIERVPSGAIFNFRVSLKVLNNGDEKLLPLLLQGMRLLEDDGIGGAGSRGYGKIKFNGLTLNGESIQTQFQATKPFDDAA